MRDADIVRAVVADERDGLSEAYRAYADRLYDCSLRLLGEPEAAADTVHDVFLVARERIAQLRDPDALRPWLYAITRSQCHRVLRRRNRFGPLDEATDMSDDTLDPPETDLHRQELRTLVRTAMAGLNPREYEVIHLTLRHQLDGPGLAAVLGVGVKHANALAATARAQLERSLGALLIARTRGRDCEALRELLKGWDGEFTLLWRKRINRHLASCENCERGRAVLAAPASPLSALPIAVAPEFLHDQLLTNAFDPDLVYHHAEFADRAGPYRPDGFPAPDAPRPGAASRLPSALALAAGLLVLAVSGWLALPLLTAGDGTELGVEAIPVVSLEPVAPEPARSPEVMGPVRPPDGESSPAAEPSSTSPTAQAEPSRDGQSAPVEQEPGQESPPLAITGASGQDVTPPGCPNAWTLAVSAQTRGEAAAVALTANGQTVAMGPGDASGSWYASLDGMPLDTSVAWSVTATAPDGSTATSGSTGYRQSCQAQEPTGE